MPREAFCRFRRTASPDTWPVGSKVANQVSILTPFDRMFEYGDCKGCIEALIGVRYLGGTHQNIGV